MYVARFENFSGGSSALPAPCDAKHMSKEISQIVVGGMKNCPCLALIPNCYGPGCRIESMGVTIKSPKGGDVFEFLPL